MLEVEYNVNPTVLFQHIDQSEWAEAAARAHSVPIEAKTWLVSKTGGKLEWRYLPLHLCLQFNPAYEVIEALLQVYPDAACQPDHEGRLPLHVYCHANSLTSILDEQNVEGIVDLLLQIYPDSLSIVDDTGLTPLQTVENICRTRYSSRVDSIRKALIHATKARQSISPPHLNHDEDGPESVTVSGSSSNSSYDGSLRAGNSQTNNRMVSELETALSQSQRESNNANEEVARLQGENQMCLDLIERLKTKLADATASTGDGLAVKYERQLDEAHQDLEECRNKLKVQVATFEKELISLSAANDAAVRDLKQQSAKKEKELERKTKGLISVNNKLSDEIETLKERESDHNSRIDMLQKAMAKERATMKDEAKRMDQDRNNWEEEKEELVKSIKFLKQSLSDQASITKTAFSRRIEELEGKHSEKDRAIEQLTSQLQIKAAEIEKLESEAKDTANLERENSDMQSKIDDQSKEIVRLRENAQKALQMTSADFHSKKRELEEQVIRQQRLLDEKSKEYGEMKEKNRLLIQKLDSLKGVMTEMKEKGSAMARSRASLDEENQKLKDKLENATKDLQQLKNEHEIETKVSDSTIQGMERKIEELHRKVKESETKRNDLKDAITKNNETVRAKVKVLNKEKKTLASQKESLEKTIKELQSRCDAFQMELGEYKKRYYNDRATKRYQSTDLVTDRFVQRKLDDANKKVNLLTAENKKLRTMIQSGTNPRGPSKFGWEQEIALENLKLQVINLEGEKEILQEKLKANERHEEDPLLRSEITLKNQELLLLEKENTSLKLTIEQLESNQKMSSSEESQSSDGMPYLDVTKMSYSMKSSSTEKKSDADRSKELEDIKQENKGLSQKLQDVTSEKIIIETKHSLCDEQIQSLKKRVEELENIRDELKDKIETNNLLHFERVREVSEKKQEVEKELFTCQMKLDQTRKVLDETIRLQQEFEGYGIRSDIYQTPVNNEWMEDSEALEPNESSYHSESVNGVSFQTTGDSKYNDNQFEDRDRAPNYYNKNSEFEDVEKSTNYKSIARFENVDRKNRYSLNHESREESNYNENTRFQDSGKSSKYNESGRFQVLERNDRYPLNQESRNDETAEQSYMQKHRRETFDDHQPRTDFSSSPIDAAYMIGERLGDLYNQAAESAKISKKDTSLRSLSMNRENSLLSQKMTSPKKENNVHRRVILQESGEEQVNAVDMGGLLGNIEAAKNRCLTTLPM